MLRLAVLGGTGFLGRAILGQCAARAREVEAWSVARHVAHVPGTASRLGDIRTGDGLAAGVAGADVVIHAAGLAHQHGGATPSEMDAVNAHGVQHVMDACRSGGVRKVVLVSSVAVYGGTAGAVATEQTPCTPASPYGRSKHAGEMHAARAADAHGIELVILRMATVYGAEDPGNLARLIRAIDHLPVILVAGGRKSLVHRRDAAAACVTAAVAETECSGTFNVVGGVHSLEEVVAVVARALRRQRRQWRIPVSTANAISRVLSALPSGTGAALALERFVADEAYSGDAFALRFAFEPTMSLAAGIAEEVAWYRTMSNGPL